MSLLNKVLRDLERRGVGGALEAEGTTAGVRAVDAPPARSRRTLAMVAVLICGLGAAALLTYDLPAFWTYSRADRPKSPAGATPRAAAVQPASAAQPEVSTEAAATDVQTAMPEGATAPQASEPALLRELRLASEIESPIGGKPAGSTDGPAMSSPPAQGPSATQADAPVSPKAAPQPERKPAEARAVQAAAIPSNNIEMNVRQPDVRQRAHEAVERGLQVMARHQYEEARREFSTALELDPRNDRARQAVLSALLAQDQKTAAEAVADEGMLNGSAKVGFALVSARLKLERGAVKEALSVLERERAAGAAHADYVALWGNALSRESRYAESARMYAAAVELAPGNPAHQVGLGYALRNDGQYAAAQSVFESVAGAPGLPPQLSDLVEQQLSSLRRLVVKR